MADLFLRIKADYTDAEKCREELKKVEAQLKAVDQNTSPKEIERLTKEYVRLSQSWESSMSSAAKTGVLLKEAYRSIGNFVRGYKDSLSDTSNEEKTHLSELKNKLHLQEALTDELKKQKSAAEALRNTNAEGYERNNNILSQLKDKLDKKYQSKGEGFYSAEDQAKLEDGRKHVENWRKAWEETNATIEVYDMLLGQSVNATEKLKNSIANFEPPKLDANTTFGDLKAQLDKAEEEVATVQKELDNVERRKEALKKDMSFQDSEVSRRQDVDAAIVSMEQTIKAIEDNREAYAALQQEMDAQKRTEQDLITQRNALIQSTEELKAKMSEQTAEMTRMVAEQDKLTVGSEEYRANVDKMKENNAEWLANNDELVRQQEELDGINEKLSEQGQKYDELSAKMAEKRNNEKELFKDYSEQVAIINNSSENQNAIQAAISKKEQDNALLEQANHQADETNNKMAIANEKAEELKSLVEQYGDIYKGFVGSDYEKTTRVYGNEEEFNRANELALKAEQLQGQIQNGVQKGNITTEELQRLQEELSKTQEEFNKLDGKARDTAMLLGGEMAQKAAAMTERLFAANKAVKEAETSYNALTEELKNAKEALANLEKHSSDDKSITEWKTKVDELTDSLNKQTEALAAAKAEQKDAQTAINKTGGELGETIQELKSSEGVFDDIDNAVSMLPGPLQNVVSGIKGVGSAMKILMKNPLMIFLSGIVLALQALWQWFQKTEEGQRAFAKISGYVGGVLSRLEEIVIAVGGAIFKFGKIAYQAFSNPKKAITDFAKTIREYIWNMVSRTSEMFGAMGTLIKNVFTGNWDNLGKDLDNVKKKVKAAFDSTPLGALANGVVDLTKKTGEWVSETHKVGLENAKIKQDEQALGDEIEKNREKTIKLQKSMAELQATMRNTNLSKAERQKAMEEYKKALEQQAQIQRDFAEKRRSLQERRMAISPNTIEDYRELSRLSNDVLQADLNMQRQLTSLQRIDNSINKSSKGGGKSKEQLQEEYANLLDEQAQKQAKQIRENGYVIEQARIDSMKEGTEKTIAQMKLDYKKELDAATEYENELTRQKIKMAREAFYKDPKNKKKVFDVTAVDLSFTDQEMQVLAAKASDAESKYQNRIESLYSKYETFAEKRTKTEKDFNSLQDFNASLIAEKTLEIGRLYDELSDKSGEEADVIKKKINGLELEINLLEEKGMLIEANKKLQMAELEGMLEYMKQFGSMQEKQAAIIQEYENKIAKARAEGNTWEVKRLEKEKEKETSKLKADELLRGIDFSQMVDGVGGIVRAMAAQVYNRIQNYKTTDQYKGSSVEEKKAISELEQQMIAKGGAGATSPFSMKSWDKLSKATKRYQTALVNLQDKTQEHSNAVSKLKEAQLKVAKTLPNTEEYLLALGDAANAAAEVERTKAEQEAAELEKDDSESDVNDASVRLKQGMENFNTILGQISSGTVSGLAEGVANIISVLDKDEDNNMGGLAGLGKVGGIISAILALIDALGAEPTKFIDDLLTKVAAVIEGVISELWQIVEAIIQGIGNIIGSIGTGIASWFTGEDFNSNRAKIEEENKRLTTAMQVNTEAINRLTKAMESATPVDATKYYEQAKSLIESNERNAIRQMTNNAYMYDGGHSLNYDYGSDYYYQNAKGDFAPALGPLFGQHDNNLEKKGYVRKSVIEEIFKKVEKTPIGGTYDLGGLIQSLTAADWKKLYEDTEGRELMTMLGNRISEAEDAGNYNGLFGDIMSLINEYGDAYDNLIDKFNESVTHISFDSMYSSFVSNLMDMDKKASDFANDFEGYIRNAIYQSLAAEQLQPLLKKWYGAFASFLKNDGRITESEIYMLRHSGGTYTDEEGNEQVFQSIDSISDSALDLRDTIEELGLYNGKNGQQQSATANSIMNISYDQADAMEGTLIAQLIVQEQIKATLEGMAVERQNQSLLTATPTEISGVYAETRDIAADSRDILAGMAIHVEEIRDGVVDTIVPRIKNIDDNLVKVYRLVEEQ